MRTRKHWGLQLFVICLLAAALPASVSAQNYPPFGPTIPPVPLTGGGRPHPRLSPLLARGIAHRTPGTWSSSAITTCRGDRPTSRSSSTRTAGRSPTSATTTTRSRS